MLDVTDNSAAELARDLGAFADLGTDLPQIEQTKQALQVTFVRNGDVTRITLNLANNTVVEEVAGERFSYQSIASLLASDRYGNLRSWAANQLASLASTIPSAANSMHVGGQLNGGVDLQHYAAVERHLSRSQNPGTTRVLLIDGPAGIGKTHFISEMVSHRAKQYLVTRQPLILHVQSRGRTLTFLFDLIAYSLQRMRVNVTYDQVPVLAKYGLVSIAIDGFDELADPDGYDLAWAQVSDLVKTVRGQGTLILAGRETFIGRERILKDVHTLRRDLDELDVLTLIPPTKGESMQWLERQGWSEDQLVSIEPFLEPGSLALRPFFLSTLADRSISDTIATARSSSVLSILVEAMVEREITKFGEAVEKVLSAPERRKYVRNFMCEVARDMAENNSVSVSDATLAWLVDVATPKQLPENLARILRGRSQVLAFLTNDDRPGYRRFYHDKFYEYFVSEVLVQTISNQENSKILSRSIIGSSLLETFSEITSSGSIDSDVPKFLDSAFAMLESYPNIDRTRRNVAATVIASLSHASGSAPFLLSDIELDEARFAETAGAAVLTRVVISQFDLRGADVSAVEFNESYLVSLIADDETIVSNTFPKPVLIQDLTISGPITDPEGVNLWLEAHLAERPATVSTAIPDELLGTPSLKILHRAARLRQYWLRKSDDIFAAKILDDPDWPAVERALLDNNLLRVEDRQASGSSGRFVHIRQRDAILAGDLTNPDVVSLYKRLAAEAGVSPAG